LTSLLFVDANILVRCSVGRAALDIDELRAKGVALATTDAQAREAKHVLHHKFGVPVELAAAEVDGVISCMEVYHAPTYRGQQAAAQARIHHKNTKDWPILAAAIASNADIWTDDRDFFGVGVPTWTTRNVRFFSSGA
jgi:hypothetical protein